MYQVLIKIPKKDYALMDDNELKKITKEVEKLDKRVGSVIISNDDYYIIGYTEKSIETEKEIKDKEKIKLDKALKKFDKIILKVSKEDEQNRPDIRKD